MRRLNFSRTYYGGHEPRFLKPGLAERFAVLQARHEQTWEDVFFLRSERSARHVRVRGQLEPLRQRVKQVVG